MATYFGYVEREADSYVNWADVGRNMSATIDNIQRVRDEKKALIEKAYREDLDFIQANPSGQHETINGWSLNFGNTSAENLKLKYSQLKQGKITVNDFVTFRQNLTDSVEKIYGVTGRLQEIYKDVEERTKNDENQLIERETKVLLEKYGQLENTLPYVNGLTGSVAIGLTDVVEEDGKKVRKLRQGEGSYLTPNQLQAAAEEKFNNFDEQAVINAWVEKTGKVQQDIRSIGGESVAGLITSIEDITYDNISVIIESMPEDKRPPKQVIDAIKGYAKEFEEAERLFIDGMVAKDTDASAILTEKIKIDPKTGKPYTIVWDKKDATSSDKLYVEKSSDGSGRFTPVFDVNATKDEEKHQMNAIKNYLKSQIRVKLDRIVKQQPFQEPQKQQAYNRAPTPEESKGAANRQNVANFGSIVGRVYGQDYASRESALSSLTDWLPEDGYAFFGKDNQGDYVLASKGGQDRKKIYLTKNGKPVPIDDFTADFSSYVIGTRAIGTDLDAARARARQESRGGTFSTDFGDANNRNFVFWNDPYEIQEEYRKYKAGKDAWDKSGVKAEYPDQAKLNDLKVALDKFSFLNESGQQGGTTEKFKGQ